MLLDWYPWRGRDMGTLSIPGVWGMWLPQEIISFWWASILEPVYSALGPICWGQRLPQPPMWSKPLMLWASLPGAWSAIYPLLMPLMPSAKWLNATRVEASFTWTQVVEILTTQWAVCFLGLEASPPHFGTWGQGWTSMLCKYNTILTQRSRTWASDQGNQTSRAAVAPTSANKGELTEPRTLGLDPLILNMCANQSLHGSGCCFSCQWGYWPQVTSQSPPCCIISCWRWISIKYIF